MERKYKLTKKSKIVLGIRVYQIEALKDFYLIKKGDLGGWIEKESNLSHDGVCWIHDNACAIGSSIVSCCANMQGDSMLFDSAKLYGRANLLGNAKVSCNAKVYGSAFICGNSKIYGLAEVCGGTWVGDDASIFNLARVNVTERIRGNDQVSRSPICVDDFPYPLLLTDNNVTIGGMRFSKEQFRNLKYQDLADKFNLSKYNFNQIKSYALNYSD